MLGAELVEQRLEQPDGGVGIAGAGEQARELEVEVDAVGGRGRAGRLEGLLQELEGVLLAAAADGDLAERLERLAGRVRVALGLRGAKRSAEHLLGLVVAFKRNEELCVHERSA